MPVKPTDKEEEYFALREFERLRELEQAKQQKLGMGWGKMERIKG